MFEGMGPHFSEQGQGELSVCGTLSYCTPPDLRCFF